MNFFQLNYAYKYNITYIQLSQVRQMSKTFKINTGFKELKGIINEIEREQVQ